MSKPTRTVVSSTDASTPRFTSGFPAAVDPEAAPVAADLHLPHPVEQLARSLGAADATDLAVALEGLDGRAMQRLGTSHQTDAVCNEVVRVGAAVVSFFAGASDEQKAAVCVTLPLVRVMVHCAVECLRGDRAAQRRKAEGRDQGAVDVTSQQGALTSARAESKSLATCLRGIYAGDKVALTRIRNAERPGAAKHADAGPGRTLSALCEIAQEAIRSPAPTTARRAALWNLTAARIARAEAIVSGARAATHAQGIAGGAIDVERSRVLHFRGVATSLCARAMRAFADGHHSNAVVPMMAPHFLRALIRKPKKAVPTTPRSLAERTDAPKPKRKRPSRAKQAAPAESKAAVEVATKVEAPPIEAPAPSVAAATASA